MDSAKRQTFSSDRWMLVVAAGLFIAALIALGLSCFATSSAWSAIAAGAGVSCSFGLFAYATSATCGEDGRPSSSKLQFVVWTFVLLFLLTGLLARTLPSGASLPGDFPEFLVIAAGLSSATLLGAKGIARNEVERGRRSSAAEEKHRSRELPPKKGGFFTGDDGDTSLTKVQMLVFNTLGASVLLLLAIQEIMKPGDFKWPSPDETLLAFCGLGNATYVGRKLVPSTDPSITSVSPSGDIRAGQTVTIRGSNFGAEAGIILLDDMEVGVGKLDWSTHAVTFVAPFAGPNGKEWPPPGMDVAVKVERADGLASQSINVKVLKAAKLKEQAFANSGGKS